MKLGPVLAALTAAITALVSAGHALAAPPVPVEVPEPATLAVLAAGVGALAWVKFRGRR